MRRNKEAYMNYVCPYCFNSLNKCICKLYPPYHLIWIDKGIQEHIRALNQKGYTTTNCCESHALPDSIYIMFANDYGFGESIAIPEGFKYHKKKRLLCFYYDTKVTNEELEIIKKEKLNILLEWCKSLSNIRED